MEIDTTNKFLVACQGDKIRLLRAPAGLLSKEEALNLAAWLVTLADGGDDKFPDILNAVQNT